MLWPTDALMLSPDTAPALPLHRPRRGTAPAAAPPLRPGIAPRHDPRPPSRPGIVPRTRLVRRLVAARDTPVVLLVAPAGYGKTQVLEEWAVRDGRPFSWVSLASQGPVEALEHIATCRAAQVIVVDDAHVAPPPAVADLLEAGCRLPPGSTLALASRVRPEARVGRLRAHRLAVELSAADLAMSRLEAAMLVDASGLQLDAAQLDRLLEHTRGWPAALYLAAASIADDPDRDAAIARFNGGDRDVAEYLRDELLDDLTVDERAFLRRTSILSRLTPAVCDDVLQTHGSGAVVRTLARRGLPIEPLDRRDLAFSYHPLLAATLRAELEQLEPELEPELHRRAARSYASRSDAAAAIRHAAAGGDAELAGTLLWSLAPREVLAGRNAVVREGLRHFGERVVRGQPGLALAAAAHDLAGGRCGPAERSIDAAERALEHASLAGGHAAVTLLRACVARDGLAGMARDAERARALLPSESPWQGLAVLLLGVAHHLRGGRQAAARLLEDAVSIAADRLETVTALACAQLALLAVEAEDWDEADRCAREAHAALGTGAAPPVRALVLAACAVVAAHRGDVAQARHDATDTARLLASSAGFPAWLSAEAHVWLARAEIRLSDGPTARALLARAARIQPRIGDDRVVSAWIHEGWARADAFAESATGDGPMLTNAELRVLRLLPSHMSFREIGERLHVSTNTVKTQALSVYRKLDVSCRSDAVARGRRAGLLGGT